MSLEIPNSEVVRAKSCPSITVRNMHANELGGVPDAQRLHMLDCDYCNKDMFPEHIRKNRKSEWYEKGHLVWCSECN